MAGGRHEWIGDPGRLAEIGPAWDRLAEREGTPFGSHAWFRSWWEAFGSGRRLSISASWEGDELRAALPLWLRNRELHALANEHTPLFRPLARDREALRDVVEPVLATSSGRVAIPALPTGEESLAVLSELSRRVGRLTLIQPQHTSPIVDTTGGFESYRGQTKSRWGAPLERFHRKAIRDHDASFFVVEAPTDVEAELRRGLELEARGWKGRAGTAILSSQETARFYHSLAMRFHAAGKLRLSGMLVDGRLAAFDFSILHAGRLYLLKTAYDEVYRRLAPGLVLRLSIIERCFELGIEANELLGDAEPWKQKFATSVRAHSVLHSYPRRPVGAVRYGYRGAVRPALKWARRRTLGRSQQFGSQTPAGAGGPLSRSS
jgi:CelD/BcsL family acetyltransferase involved in cellulose biosynthesis